MAMSKKTKRNLAIAGGVAAVAAVGYTVLKKEEPPPKKNGNGRVTRPPPGPGPGEPGGPSLPARGQPGGPPPLPPSGSETTGAGWATNAGDLATWYVFHTPSPDIPIWRAGIVWPDGRHQIYDRIFPSGAVAVQYIEAGLTNQGLKTAGWFPKDLWTVKRAGT